MVVLGSTGSIGVNTLRLAKKYHLDIEVLVAGVNAKLLQSQIEQFHPKKVVVANKETFKKIQHKNKAYGKKAILEAIATSKSKTVINAIVGFAGLEPTLEALKNNKKLALANKESLVICGSFIDTKNIIPIDSEHFGLLYLINNRPIKKMIITASGGAFRDKSYHFIKNATLKDVLKHPNWQMGQKITIDSATMVNKIFELIEAYWLFKKYFHKKVTLDAFIETRSIIHALIDFKDGSTTAHIAKADMKLPISYALNIKQDEKITPHIDFSKLQKLEFKPIEPNKYAIWSIKDDLLKNPKLGVVINGANEVMIEKFLQKKCGFLDIGFGIIKAYKKFCDVKIKSIEDVFEVDKEVRKFVRYL